jgi:hypothetical protein
MRWARLTISGGRLGVEARRFGTPPAGARPLSPSLTVSLSHCLTHCLTGLFCRYARRKELRSSDGMYVRKEAALWALLHTPPTTARLHVEELVRRFKTHCTPVAVPEAAAAAGGGGAGAGGAVEQEEEGSEGSSEEEGEEEEGSEGGDESDGSSESSDTDT